MSIAHKVHQLLRQKNKKLALAESCSGGAIAARLVAIPDASQFLLGSIVAYSPHWKEQFLQVKGESLRQFGPESAEVAEEMAEQLLAHTAADYALAVSGFASPPGIVFISVAERSYTPITTRHEFVGTRSEVIHAIVEAALIVLLERISA
ncbi:MAG: CinA family protein [Chlamydiia bacterium]|nr:CinA family protein [Chlamydiia bacterium]